MMATYPQQHVTDLVCRGLFASGVSALITILFAYAMSSEKSVCVGITTEMPSVVEREHGLVKEKCGVKHGYYVAKGQTQASPGRSEERAKAWVWRAERSCQGPTGRDNPPPCLSPMPASFSTW